MLQEGARVHSVPFDVEFLADKLFLAFALARDVLLVMAGTLGLLSCPFK